MTEDFDKELRTIKLECLKIASKFEHVCIHDLMDEAEQLFMFICGFERVNSPQNPEDN
jgi:hypothetical protein